MVARELMTPEPRVVTGSDPVSHVARLMRDFDIGMVPVVDDAAHRHARGVITDRDIVVRASPKSTRSTGRSRTSFRRPPGDGRS